jgi:hypothetical protein
LQNGWLPLSSGMIREILNKNSFIIRGGRELYVNKYHLRVFDAEKKSLLLECKENKRRWATRLIRVFGYFSLSNYHLHIHTTDQTNQFSIHRPSKLFSHSTKIFVKGSLAGKIHPDFNEDDDTAVIGHHNKIIFFVKPIELDTPYLRFIGEQDMEIARLVFDDNDVLTYRLEISEGVPADTALRSFLLMSALFEIARTVFDLRSGSWLSNRLFGALRYKE